MAKQYPENSTAHSPRPIRKCAEGSNQKVTHLTGQNSRKLVLKFSLLLLLLLCSFLCVLCVCVLTCMDMSLCSRRVCTWVCMCVGVRSRHWVSSLFSFFFFFLRQSFSLNLDLTDSPRLSK